MSSYLAFPPLPRERLARRYISVALVLGSTPGGVTRYPCLWSPDFPHAQAFASCPRPLGLLVRLF